MVSFLVSAQQSRLARNPGSTEFQVLLLTQRIFELRVHLRVHPRDYAAIRGLRKILGHRKRLIRYFKVHHSRQTIKLMQFIKLLDTLV